MSIAKITAFQTRDNKLFTTVKELFKYDLFEEYDVQNNPKKELLYSKASECSEGSLPDIEEWFADLVDLIK